MHNPWEIFYQDRVRHHKMMHGPPQTHFRSNPEQQQKHLQDEQQAPRKNQMLRHKSPMKPPSCLGARWKLAYENMDGHCIIPIRKTNEDEEWRQTQW